MQSENEDRRASHVRRVELETLVEICGRDQAVPPFEAESVEISGRGMQVRTRFLPELHAPLVLRFEHDGHEVLVEGQVAWRKGDEQGGQFGIKFTALDSKSVAALKALSARAEAAAAEDDAASDEAAPGEQPVLTQRGAPVKLHIQGLGAPMKARVFRGSARKLEVGSQLEFLKVGKSLELEDVSAGNRRAAHIDSVSVAIDAQSQIPQLVVSLRYEGVEDDTPAPTVLGQRKDKKKLSASAARDDSDDDADADYSDDEPEPEEDEFTEDIFKGKVGALAASAGRAMKNGSVQVASWGSSAVGGFGDLVKGISAKVGSSKPRATTQQRRTSRPPQGAGPRAQARRGESLRPQQSARRTSEEARPSRRIKPWLYGGALAACMYGTYAWLGHAADQDVGYVRESSESAARGADLAARAAARGLAGAPAPAQEQGLEGAVTEGAGQRFPKGAALSAEQQQQATKGGVIAQVPLFGPTEMATSEGAPVNPPPRSEVIDEYSMAKDQVFPEDRLATGARPQMPQMPGLAPAATGARAPAAMAVSEQPAVPEKAETQEVGNESFQVGRMHLPVVYRLRLDGAASALQGSKLATGFSVLVPGRKVMESGSAIEGRDDRIVDVHVQNTPAGGKVTFRFRKDIPGYKARLRKDYVEFFINSPEKKH